MTALDFTDPVAMAAEAQRRRERRAAGLPLHVDERQHVAGVDERQHEDDGDLTWQEVQRRCYRVFAKAGCEVWWLSQVRKSGQTPGLPDLMVFGPPGAPFLLMWDSKAGRAKLSPAQKKFELHCQRTKTHFASGGEAAARRTLKALIAEAKNA